MLASNIDTCRRKTRHGRLSLDPTAPGTVMQGANNLTPYRFFPLNGKSPYSLLQALRCLTQ